MAIASMRVPTIFTAVDRFSSVISKMSASTSAFGQTAQAAAMRSSRSFNSAGNKMLGAGISLGTGIGFAVNEAVNFEDKMASINTILSATPQAMNDVKKTIFDVGKSTGVPLTDLASNFYELASAQITGKRANEALSASAKLSVSGLGDMTASTNIMISTLNGFKREGLTANDVLEKISRTIQKGKLKVADMNESFAKNGVLVGLAGVKLDEYLSMQAAMTTAGLPISEAQNAIGLAAISLVKMGPKIKKVTDSMNINPSEIVKLQKAQQGLFKGLNVKTGEDLVTKLGGMVPAMQAMTAQAKKLGVPIELVFGRQGAIIANALLTGDALKEYRIEMDYLAQKGINVADAMFKVKQATTKFKFNIIKNEVKELAITLGDALLPKIKDFANSAINASRNIMNWSENNKGFVNTLFTITKWLLILGVALKIGAFLYYTIAKAIAFASWIQTAYTTVTELCTVATILAAAGQQTFAASLLAVAGGLLAAYWPVLVVIGLLGGLAYAFSDIGDSTESMVNKQISSLSKGNSAWENSTKVMSKELTKQKGLTQFNTSSITSQPLAGGILGSIAQRKAEKKAEISKLPALKPINNFKLFNSNSTPIRVASQNANVSTTENLAGQNNNNMDLLKNLLNKSIDNKQTLDLNITAPQGYDVESKNTPRGINVITNPNQGTR